MLEALQGGELSYHIFRHGPFTHATARSLLKQLVDGVACIHRAGYLHRDLKPWNIMLSNDQSGVKIIDFGLATKLEDSERMAPFDTFMSGTVQYMAPELLLKNGKRLNADLSKVDTFALGVILINMLTGSYLFSSCKSQEYEQLVVSTDKFEDALRGELSCRNEEDADFDDLVKLLKAMVHPDLDMRLSIEQLEDKDCPEAKWLHSPEYQCSSQAEIRFEVTTRIRQSNQFHR